MKKVLICGSGGFIGGNLSRKLKEEGCWVRGIDLKKNEYYNDFSDEFILDDLRKRDVCERAIEGMDEVYQLAADMGGAGYLFSGENDANVMHNSALINLNVLDACVARSVKKIFYASSACVYPEYNQENPNNPICNEDSVYPAQPDSEYGWEKLFGERLYLAYAKNYDLEVRIARFHNIFGPKGTWKGGKEKAPAAICRKIAEACNGGVIEIWGDGEQTRTFLFVDECVEGISRLMESDFSGPVNIGSEELLSINKFTDMVIAISGKRLKKNHIEGPLGVRGRTSDNTLIFEKLKWKPSMPLKAGLTQTYEWIKSQVDLI
jgi:GDP-D-mannose 3',5'-epimerase